MEHPIRNAVIGIGITAALVGGAILRPDQHIMSAEDYLTRERVLSSYPFTFEAVTYLNKIPYFNRHTTTNGGGHAHDDDFPYGDWSETYSDQDEAILHEFSHVWYDHMATDNPDFPLAVMNGMQQAVEGDKAGGYFKHLEWGFNQDWKGIDHSDATEWYASTASYTMGGTKYAFPEALKDVYKYEFRIDPDMNELPIYTTPGDVIPPDKGGER